LPFKYTTCSATPWFAFNRALEAIFAVDICVQFIKAFRDDDEVGRCTLNQVDP